MPDDNASGRVSPKLIQPPFVHHDGELVEFTKAGNISRMRSHRGNKPAIPQTQLCHLCPAKFTRITHLHRHLRTHTNERMHECDRCHTQFTRSDLLTRHKRSCGDPANANRTRRKSCQACADGKTKCDLQQPCSRCKARDRECTYVRTPSVRVKKSPSLALSTPSPDMQRDGGGDNASAFPSPTAGPSAQPAHGGIFVSPSSAPQRFHNPLTGSPSEFDFIPQAPNIPASTSLANYMDQARSVPSSYASSIYSDTTDNFPPTRGDSLTSFAQDALEVNNQLNALFSTELFDKFFCDAFEESSVHSLDGSQAVYGLNDMLNDGGNQLPYAAETVDMQPFMGSMPPPDFDLYNLETNFMSAAAISTGTISNISPVFPDPTVEPSVIPYPSEFQNYTHLFYTMFLAQIPIMHVPTFTIDGKPQILISAMQACGALYVRTQAAAKFIEQTLASARDQLVGEFARNPTKSEDQVHLILAVVLLQTIGLFHQQPEQRSHSSIYHGMLVMMIRQSGLIERATDWVPPITDGPAGDSAWRDWALHETTKRALLLSYLHDCCHCIYFTLRPTFLRNEMTVPLPCDDLLWNASSMPEWKFALQRRSPYGSAQERLRPSGLQTTLSRLADISSGPEIQLPLVVTPFAHFVLAHAILRKLFEDCVEKRPMDPQQEGFSIQFMLHNWLQSWMNSPDTPRYAEGEPIFLHDALPFYWIAQVTLLAYQENLPPFATSSGAPGASALGEAKFRLVKEWLKHIREFLCKGEQGPTLFWDELTKIRMKNADLAREASLASGSVASDDSRGLLGFFAGEA